MTACWQKEAKSGSKDLRDAYLVNADLRNIDLRRVNLTGAQIVNTDLSGANLSGATLTKVNLGGTNFTSANFSEAKITGVVFQGNNLTNADFTGAIFTRTAFWDTKIGGAKINLIPLQCKVTTNGENLNWEDSNGKVYGSLKNGTIVYRDFFAWDNGRINVSEQRGDELVSVGLVDGKFVTCGSIQTEKSKSSIQSQTLAGNWKLSSLLIESDMLYAITEPLIINLDGNGKISGNGGCIDFQGKYAFKQPKKPFKKPQKITFSQIVSTDKDCETDSNTEKAFLQSLKTAATVVFEEGYLVIKNKPSFVNTSYGRILTQNTMTFVRGN